MIAEIVVLRGKWMEGEIFILGEVTQICKEGISIGLLSYAFEIIFIYFHACVVECCYSLVEI